jgi:hypothetical protein
MSSHAFFGTVFDDQTRVSINVFSELKSQLSAGLSGGLLEGLSKLENMANSLKQPLNIPTKS